MGLSILVRLPGLDQLPDFDELYTLPAATSMMTEGVPRIAGGVYERAIVYTTLLAEWFRVFGASLVAARLFSVLFGVLLVAAVFLWTDRVAGRVPAWIAALFVALDPLSIHVSQFARFYALYALLFWLAATGVYSVVAEQHRLALRAAIAVGVVLCLALALHLQMLTLLGGIGLLIWTAGMVAWRFRAHWRWIAAGAIASAVVVVAVAGLVLGETLQPLLQRYLETPLSVAQYRGQIWFYHIRLIERYPALWPVFPFLAIIAAAARPKATFFALAVFGTALALLSFGGPKNWRYLFFVLPFLFVVWGIALASLWGALRTVVMTATDRLLAPINGHGRAPLLIGACLFLVFANGAPTWTLLHPLGITLGRDAHMADWPMVVDTLREPVAEADVVVTSHEVYVLHYFGRGDITLSKRRLAEFGDREFDRDPRTGMPTISTAASLDRLMSCHTNGLILIDEVAWREPTMIDRETSDFILAHTEEIALPARSRVRAFQWRTPALADDCDV